MRNTNVCWGPVLPKEADFSTMTVDGNKRSAGQGINFTAHAKRLDGGKRRRSVYRGGALHLSLNSAGNSLIWACKVLYKTI